MPRKNAKSGTEERRRKPMIGFRVDDIENEEITAAAEAEGLTVASFCRATLLKKTRTMPRKKLVGDAELLARLLVELGRCGNNLNQIAKRLNEGKGVTPERAILALNHVRDLKESILKALRRPDDSEGQELQPCGEPR